MFSNSVSAVNQRLDELPGLPMSLFQHWLGWPLRMSLQMCRKICKTVDCLVVNLTHC